MHDGILSDEELTAQAQAAYDALEAMPGWDGSRPILTEKFRTLMIAAEQRGLIVPLVYRDQATP